MRRLALLVALIGVLCTPSAASAVSTPPTPVLAYYYIWFTPNSWSRAKADLPVLGRYSSDDETVMRRHVTWAKRAGIDGFLVSWKSTPTLDERLARLIRIADGQNFKLGIVYEGLDFEHNPLPIDTVEHDLTRLAAVYAQDRAFSIFDRPLVIWSGTPKYTHDEVLQVTGAVKNRLLVLASARNVRDFKRIDDLVDGNAYYWSSVNPSTYPRYTQKLAEMSSAVHARGGLWIAPFAPGFDARKLGGKTIVPRAQGATLRTEYSAALGSSPDALGLISWNEFSEDSYVEPSRRYGASSLSTLAALRGAQPPQIEAFDSDASLPSTGSGFSGLPAVLGAVGLLVATTILLRWRLRRAAAHERSRKLWRGSTGKGGLP